MTEDEMVGWHHPLNGYEFEQALGVGDGQKNLACCSPWIKPILGAALIAYLVKNPPAMQETLV